MLLSVYSGAGWQVDMNAGEGFDTLSEAVEYFVLESWEALGRRGYPPTQVLWSDYQREFVASVVGMDVSMPQAVVLTRRHADGYMATGWGCRSGILNCDCPTPSTQVTYSWLLPCDAPETRSVTVNYRRNEQHIRPVDKYVYFTLWSETSNSFAGPWIETEFTISVNDNIVWDAATQPCWLQHVLATPAEFAAAHQRYYWDSVVNGGDYQRDFWTQEVLHGCKNPSEKLSAVQCLVSHVEDMAPQDSYLGFVGGGPLEELMSDWLLDELSKEEIDRRMVIALKSVRMDNHPEHLQKRVSNLRVPKGIVRRDYHR